MATIYALCDPRLDGKAAIRYIGVTIRTLAARLSVHMANAKDEHDKSHRSRWIRKLLREGARPVIVALEEAAGNGRDAERRAIAEYRAAGCRLTNSTDGGDGNWGWVPGDETRARIGAAISRAWNDPHFRARVSAARRERCSTEEWRQAASARARQAYQDDPTLVERIKAARQPRVVTDEERQKRSESMRRKWQDSEYRENVTSRVREPEVRAKIGAATSRRCQDKAYRARLGSAIRKSQGDQWRERQSASQSERWNGLSDEDRRVFAERLRAGWAAHPESRERLAATARARASSDEEREAMRERSKRAWADPEVRARWMAARWPHRVSVDVQQETEPVTD